MNLWFRFARAMVISARASKIPWNGTSEISFRVWPNDLDINLHMNNARYLAVMDLGRLGTIFRCGLWPFVRDHKLAPVVAGSMIRFRRSLGPFQKFTVTTQLIGWDKRWLYFDHKIISKSEIACHGIIKACFLRKGVSVPPAELADAVGYKGDAPELPQWLHDWVNADETALGKGRKS